MAERLRGDGIRVLGAYPSDFDHIAPGSEQWSQNTSDDGLLTSRSIWEGIVYALSQPRDCRVEKLVMKGLRWDQV